MESRPMFFRQTTDTFLVRTEPASSIVKPAHIHMTMAPQKKKEKLLNTKPISASIAATASHGRITTAAASRIVGRRFRELLLAACRRGMADRRPGTRADASSSDRNPPSAGAEVNG